MNFGILENVLHLSSFHQSKEEKKHAQGMKLICILDKNVISAKQNTFLTDYGWVKQNYV